MVKRTRTRLLAPLCVGAGVFLAGCGGGGGHGASHSAQAQAKARIRRSWTTFFNGSTATSRRVALLQHGGRFKPVLTAQAKSSLARQSSATVSAVTLHGAHTASVRYSVDVAGVPALKHLTGTAIESAGTWQVADRTFCQLLGREGGPPAVCSGG